MNKLKKISSVCCVMVLAVALLFQNTATYCSATVNSSANLSTEIPEGYTPIYTIADLVGINSDTSGKYILMNDIDMTEETSPGGSWDTGHGWTPLNTFSGVFDGNGHRIIGMHIYGEVGYNVALFNGLEKNENTDYYYENTDYYYDNDDYDDNDKLNNSAIIKNLGMINCEIDITNNNKIYIGGIVGYNDNGTIQNCYVTGKINVRFAEGGYSGVGGIAGENQGVITNCYNTADIFASEAQWLGATDICISGISGVRWLHNQSAKIENCYSIGKITCNDVNLYYAGAMGIGAYNKNYYLDNSVIKGKSFFDSYLGGGSYGKSLTDAQMKHQTSFTGFDFNDTWMIDELSSYPYPQLKSCPQVKVNSLELKNMPSKLVYSQGDELDLSGAVLSITYEDGVVTSTEADKSMVSGVDMDVVGKQTVVIRYLNGICSFDITVNEVKAEEITLPKAEYSLNRNGKLQLNTVIKPDNTGDKSVVWETDNDVVATVTQNGVVSGINAGTATITATTANGLTASCIVTVKVPASSIKLNVRKLTLKKGKKKTLKAKINPLETTDTVKWTSSSPKVVSVTQNGVIKAKKKGYAVIMAKTTSGKYASVEVTVKR